MWLNDPELALASTSLCGEVLPVPGRSLFQNMISGRPRDRVTLGQNAPSDLPRIMSLYTG